MKKRFIKSTDGATSIEYALIASLVGLAIVGGVTNLGEENKNNYDLVSQEVNNAR